MYPLELELYRRGEAGGAEAPLGGGEREELPAYAFRGEPKIRVCELERWALATPGLHPQRSPKLAQHILKLGLGKASLPPLKPLRHGR